MIITLLKIGFCGTTFAVYINKTFKKPGLLTVVFSIFYALMAYNIIYQLNIMWLDGVICLPIIMLGIDRIIEQKKPLLYYIFLTFAILTNYYIGYMICIFSLMYFIYKMLLSKGFNDAFLKAKLFRGRLASFLFTSVLAGGTGSFLVLPAILSLKTGKEQLTIRSFGIYTNYNFFGVFSKIVLGSQSYNDVIKGMPGIFCGLFVVLLLGLYFFNRLINLKEKFYSAAFILILLVNFYFNPLNVIWHGFNAPTWFPFRYSFVFSFLLIVLAYKAVINLRGVKLRHIVLTCIVCLVVFIVLASGHYRDLSDKKIAISAVFIATYCGILIYSMHTKQFAGKLMALMLIPYVLCEFAFNSYEMLANYSFASKSYYSNFVQQTGSVIDGIKAGDTGLYRMEKTFTRLNYNAQGNPTFNDSLMFGYNGLSHYSSTDDKKVNLLMQSLGFKNNNSWAYYDRGSTVVANSLLGVKYILSYTNDQNTCIQTGYSNGIYIYKNPYALPLGFMTGSSIAKVQQSVSNLFKQQNDILNAMIPNKKAACLISLKTGITQLDNVRTVKNGGMTRYIKVDQNKPASIEFKLKAADTNQVYANFYTDKFYKVALSLNGKPIGDYFDTYDYGVLPLGSYQKDEEITLKMTLSKGETDFSSYEFCYFDMDRFQSDFSNLNSNSLDISSFSSTHITGEVTSLGNKHMLFTSIPYDNGWKVTVNGKPAVKYRILGALIGINVPQGRYKIEFNYTPQGFTAGCVISVACVVISMLYFYALFRRRRN